jgi:hypothetical protein
VFPTKSMLENDPSETQSVRIEFIWNSESVLAWAVHKFQTAQR